MAKIKDPITQGLIDSLEKYTTLLDKGAISADKLITNLNKLSDANNDITKSESNSIKKKKDLTEVEKELDRIIAQTEKNIAKRQIAEAGLTEELVKSQLASQKVAKAVKDKLQAEEKAAKQAKLSADALSKQRNKALQQIAKQEQAEKDLREALEREVKTENDAIAQNKALRQARRKLDSTTQEGTDAVEEFNKRINTNSEFLAGNADAATAAKDNVGKYQESIEAALASSDKFSGGTTDVLSNFIEIGQSEGGIKGFFKTFVSGIGSATKAGLKFILTPIGAVIAAIVVGIGLFTAAVSRNESASDGFQKIWAGITNVIDEVIGRIFKFIGAIGKFITGDFSGAVNNLSEAFTGLGKALGDAFREGQKLIEMQIALENSTIKNTTAIAEQNKIAQLQQSIADDATKSFAVREAAAEKARIASELSAKLSLELAKQEAAIVDLNVKRAIRQGTIDRTLRQEQADARAEVINLESELLTIEADNNKTRDELKQDRLEKDLDILIDGFDNQKTINERLIADDTLTLGKRESILNETKDLFEKTFAKQIETIEQFTNVNLNANDLIATSDAVALNEKIRALGLSEIIEGRLLEIIRERRIATQDLNEAEKDLAKESLAFQKTIDDDLEKEFEDQSDKELAQIKSFNQKKQDEVINSATKIIDAEKRAADERIAIQRMITESSIDLAAQGAQAISDVLFEAASQRRDEELDRISEQRDEDLEALDADLQNKLAKVDADRDANIISESQAINAKTALNNTATANKEKFNKEADAREAAIKTKQAKANKRAAFFESLLNTAIGITKAIAAAPPPINVPLIIAQAVAGGIQQAAILATPIPKFFQGTKNAPSGLISTAEKGQELIIPKGGDAFLTPHKQTFYSDMKGAEIVPNTKVKERLAQMAMGGNSMSMYNDAKVVNVLNKIDKGLKRNNRGSSVDNIRTTKVGNRIINNHSHHISRMGE